MVKPICAYNMASSVLAALGAKDAVSFAHWTWLSKPWTKPTVEGLRNQREKLPARMMVIAQTSWYNEYGELVPNIRTTMTNRATPLTPTRVGVPSSSHFVSVDHLPFVQLSPCAQAHFANQTGLAGMFKWPMRRVLEFGSLQLRLARECVGDGVDGKGVFSCGVLREGYDEPLPHMPPASLTDLPLLRRP